MICRSDLYPKYVVKRYGHGLSIFRDGKTTPLKPIIGNKNELKYVLSHNGRPKTVSIIEFIVTCKNDLKLK